MKDNQFISGMISFGWILRCKFEPGERECHNKTIQTAVDVPEENCDLVPQKTCQVMIFHIE